MNNQKRVFIKGFDENLQCRGYQFEIGKEYKIELPEGYILSENDLCTDKVFHFCDSLSNVDSYYSCADEKHNRFCEIEVLGQFCESDYKCGSNHIKIVREIVDDELNTLKGLINGNTGLFNTGCYNSGECNSGDYNTGYYNTGDYNVGEDNSGFYNTGHCNSGMSNSGSYNTGSYNTGDYNTGDHNSGKYNSGDFNNGWYNSGNRNSGFFNKTYFSTGIFCNIEPKIRVFNIQTDWTMIDFLQTKYYQAITSSTFPLVKVEKDTIDSYGRETVTTNSYEKACLLWWKGMTNINKSIIKEMPNFDIDVFCDITGIPKELV